MLIFGDIWLFLMTKNYSRLEELFVYLDKLECPAKANIIAELCQQLRPLK
jgi:hypothetical protein